LYNLFKKGDILRLIVVLLLILLSLIIFNSYEDNPSSTKRKVALIIGNSNYKGERLNALKNPENDAMEMMNVLKDRGFEIIYDVNVTESKFEEHIKDFNTKLAEDADVGLLFFAGHGIEVNNINYLLPIDATLKYKRDVKYEAINLNDIIDDMKEARNSLNIIILDACRNNPFSDTRAVTKGGLAEVKAPRGLFISYSTGAGNVALDNKKGDNGLFTKYLIEYIKEPLTLQEIFRKTRTKVKEESNGEQDPVVYDNTINSKFYFTQPSNIFSKVKDKIPPIKYRVGTASKKGNYYKVIEDLSDKNEIEGLKISPNITRGSLENCLLIQEGKLDIGTTQLDVLELHKELDDIAVLAQIYHEQLHIIVKKDSNITHFSQLEDKRISSGEKRSGSFVTGNYIYQLYFNKKMKNPSYTTLSQALERLKDKKIDAIISVVGSPANAFRDDLNRDRMNQFRLIPFDINMIKGKTKATYKPSILKYDWMNNQEIATLSTVTLLVAKKSKKYDKKMQKFIKEFNNRYRDELRAEASKDDPNKPLARWRDRVTSSLPEGIEWHLVVRE